MRVLGFLLVCWLTLPCLAQEPLLIDGHNDAAWRIRDRLGGKVDFQDVPSLHTDIVRLRRGGVKAQFWSIWVPNSWAGPRAVKASFEQIALVKRLIAQNPRDLELALTADDVERIVRRGKIACLLGLEGGHAINDSLANLRKFYAFGARYMTLSHTRSLKWVDSATDAARSDGLSSFGVSVVKEMNRLGMLVDLSHVSTATMQDALDVSSAPVIFSHSSCRALCNHPRNVPDSILLQLKAKDGVVMINFSPGFLSEECRAWESAQARVADEELEAWEAEHPRPHATVAQVADHIDHVREVAGVEHVGLGSDFDGIDFGPDGLEDVSGYPRLLAELRRRGYSAEEIRLVAGGNLLRVLRKAERLRAGR